MGSTARTLIRGADVEGILDSLNSAYAYHLAAVHWTQAVINRLHGPALLLLAPELEKAVSDNSNSARAVAGRVAELGGGVPADPAELVALSPVEGFALPDDLGDPTVIVGYALEQVRRIMSLYAGLVEQTRNADDLTHQLAIRLLGAEISLEDQMEGVLT